MEQRGIGYLFGLGHDRDRNKSKLPLGGRKAGSFGRRSTGESGMRDSIKKLMIEIEKRRPAQCRGETRLEHSYITRRRTKAMIPFSSSPLQHEVAEGKTLSIGWYSKARVSFVLLANRIIHYQEKETILNKTNQHHQEHRRERSDLDQKILLFLQNN